MGLSHECILASTGKVSPNPKQKERKRGRLTPSKKRRTLSPMVIPEILVLFMKKA